MLHPLNDDETTVTVAPASDLTFTVTTARLIQLAKNLRLDRRFYGKEAEAFLLLHGEQLRDELQSTLEMFLKEKLQ